MEAGPVPTSTSSTDLGAEPEPGQVAFFPVVDAIQEFKVETNSPPAEFGRFNGGVVNLRHSPAATRSTAPHSSSCGTKRSTRGILRAAGDKPDFRRNQFGGVRRPCRQAIGRSSSSTTGPAPGHRTHGHSTVPTVKQRSGSFTEAIGGKVPVIYDPATTVLNGGRHHAHAVSRQRHSGGPDGPAALTLLQRYPLPTSDGTANNSARRRTKSTTRINGTGASITVSRRAISCSAGSRIP